MTSTALVVSIRISRASRTPERVSYHGSHEIVLTTTHRSRATERVNISSDVATICRSDSHLPLHHRRKPRQTVVSHRTRVREVVAIEEEAMEIAGEEDMAGADKGSLMDEAVRKTEETAREEIQEEDFSTTEANKVIEVNGVVRDLAMETSSTINRRIRLRPTYTREPT